MSNLPKASSLPNLWFDESGDLGNPTQGSPTTNFVVVCLYVPTYSYKACRASMRPLLGRTPMRNRNRKGHGTKIGRKAVILQQLVIYDCKFGLIHINKETAKNYESFSASPDGKNTRTKMILYLLDCAIRTQVIKGDIWVHIDNFLPSEKEERELSNYLKNNIKNTLGNTLYIDYPTLETNLGIRCTDQLCNSVFQKVEKNSSLLYSMIQNNIFTQKEITDAHFLKT